MTTDNNIFGFLISSPSELNSRIKFNSTDGKGQQTAGWETTVTGARAHLQTNGGKLQSDRSVGALDLHRKVGASDNEHSEDSNYPAGEGTFNLREQEEDNNELNSDLIEQRVLYNDPSDPVHSSLQAIRQTNLNDFIFIATVLSLARGPFEQPKPTHTTVRMRWSPTSTEDALGLSVSDRAYMDTYDEIFQNRKKILNDGHHPTLSQIETINENFCSEHRKRITNFLNKKPQKMSNVLPHAPKVMPLFPTIPWISTQIPWFDYNVGSLTIWSPVTESYCISHCLMKILGTNRVYPYTTLRAASMDYIELQFIEYHTDNNFNDAINMLTSTWDIKGTTVVGVAASDVHHAIVIRNPIGSDYIRPLLSDTHYNGLDIYEHDNEELKMRFKSLVGVVASRSPTDFTQIVADQLSHVVGIEPIVGRKELMIAIRTSGYCLVRMILTIIAIINGSPPFDSHVLENISELDDYVGIGEVQTLDNSYYNQMKAIYKDLRYKRLAINNPFMLFFVQHREGVTPWLLYTPYSVLSNVYNPRYGYSEDFMLMRSYYPGCHQEGLYQHYPSQLLTQVPAQLPSLQPLRDHIGLLQFFYLSHRDQVQAIFHNDTLYINPIRENCCKEIVCEILALLYDDILCYNEFDSKDFAKNLLKKKVSQFSPYYFSITQVPLRSYPEPYKPLFPQLVLDSLIDHPQKIPLYRDRLHARIILLSNAYTSHVALAFSAVSDDWTDFDLAPSDQESTLRLWRSARGPPLALSPDATQLVIRTCDVFTPSITPYIRLIFTTSLCLLRSCYNIRSMIIDIALIASMRFLHDFYWHPFPMLPPSPRELVPAYTRPKLIFVMQLLTGRTRTVNSDIRPMKRTISGCYCPIPNASGSHYFSTVMRRATAHLAISKSRLPRYIQKRITGFLSRKAKPSHPVRSLARKYLTAKCMLAKHFLAYGRSNYSSSSGKKPPKGKRIVYVEKKEGATNNKKPHTNKPKEHGHKKTQPGFKKAAKDYKPGDYLGFETSFNKQPRKENFNVPRQNPLIFKPRHSLSQMLPFLAPYVPKGVPVEMLRCANFLTPEFINSPYATPKYRNGLLGKIEDLQHKVFWSFRWGEKGSPSFGYGVMVGTDIHQPFCLEFILLMLYPVFIGKLDIYLSRWLMIIGSGTTKKEIYDSSFSTLECMVRDYRKDIDAMVNLLGAKDIEEIRSITDLFPLLQERYVDCRLLFSDIKAKVDTPSVPFVQDPIARVFAYIENKPAQIVKDGRVSYACHLLLEFPKAIESLVHELSNDFIGDYKIPLCLRDLEEEDMLQIAPQLIAFTNLNAMSRDGDHFAPDALNYAIEMSAKPIACFDLSTNTLLNTVKSPNTVLLWKPKPHTRCLEYVGLTHSGVGLPQELGPCLNDDFPHPLVIAPQIFMPTVTQPPKPWYKDYVSQPGYKWYTENYKRFMNKRFGELDLEDFLDAAAPHMLLFNVPDMIPKTRRVFKLTPKLYTCAPPQYLTELLSKNMDPQNPGFLPVVHSDPSNNFQLPIQLKKALLERHMASGCPLPKMIVTPNTGGTINQPIVIAPPPPVLPGITTEPKPQHAKTDTADLQNIALDALAKMTGDLADLRGNLNVADVPRFTRPEKKAPRFLIDEDEEEEKQGPIKNVDSSLPQRYKPSKYHYDFIPDRGQDGTPERTPTPSATPRSKDLSVLEALKARANEPNLLDGRSVIDVLNMSTNRVYNPPAEDSKILEEPGLLRQANRKIFNISDAYDILRSVQDVIIPNFYAEDDFGQFMAPADNYYPVETIKGAQEDPAYNHTHVATKTRWSALFPLRTRSKSTPPKLTRDSQQAPLGKLPPLPSKQIISEIHSILVGKWLFRTHVHPSAWFMVHMRKPIPQREIYTPTFRSKLHKMLDNSALINPEMLLVDSEPIRKVITGDKIVDKLCRANLQQPKEHALVMATYPFGENLEITPYTQFKVVRYNKWVTDWLTYLGLSSCYKSQLGKEVAILCGIHLQNSIWTKKLTVSKRIEPAPAHVLTVYPCDYIRRAVDKLGTLYTPNQKVIEFDDRDNLPHKRDETKWNWASNPITPPKNELVDHTTRSLVKVLFGRDIADNKGASCMPTNWFKRVLSLGIDYLQTRGYGPINTNLPYCPWSPATPEVFGPHPYMVILGYHPPGVGDKAHFTDTVMFSNERIIYYNGRLNNPWHLAAVDALFIHPTYCLMSIPISAHVDLVFMSLEPAPHIQVTTQGVVEDMFSHFMATESSNIANTNTNHEVVKNRFAIYFCWKAYQGNVQSTGLYTTLDRMQKSKISLNRDITNSISGYQQYGVKNIHVVIARRLMRKWAHPAFLDIEKILENITQYGVQQKAWYERFIPCGIWSDEARINDAVQTWCDRFAAYRRLDHNIHNLSSHVFDALSREELMGKCKPWWVWFVTISNENIQMMRANPHDGAITPVLLTHFLLDTLDLAQEAEPFLMRWADPLSADTRFVCQILTHPHQNLIRRENNKRLPLRGVPAYLAYGSPPHDPYDPYNRNVPIEPADPPIGLRQGEPILNDVEASSDFFRAMPRHNRVLERLEYFTKEGVPIGSQRDFISYLVNEDLEHMRKPAVKYVTGVLGEVRGGPAKPVVAKTSSLNLARTVLNRHAGSRAVENPFFRAYASRLFRKEARKIATKMLHALETLDEDLSFDTYLQYIEPKNVFSYKKGYEKFKKDAQIPLLLQCMMKTNESSYPDVALSPQEVADQVRPRAIFNPSEQNKAIIGWINWILIKLIKRVLPSFVHGLDFEKLEVLIEDRIRALGVGTLILSGDGKGHDSLQHAWWIDCVDNVVTRILMPAISARVGLSKLECESILRSLTALLIPFVAYYPGTKRIMMRGNLWGTVFSGHPTRTTFGNTLRMYILYKVIMKVARVPKSAYSLLMSGDDTLNFLKPQYEQAFLNVLWQFVSRDLEVHGIGYQLKRMFVSTNVIDFLSKTGRVLDQGCVTLSRIPQRIVLGGNLQDVVRRDFKVPHHAFAVTQGFYAYEGTHTLLPTYIDYRRKHLRLLAPSEKVLTDFLYHDQLYKAALFKHQHPRRHYVEDAGSLLTAATPFGIFQGFQPTPLFYELAHLFGYDSIEARVNIG